MRRTMPLCVFLAWPSDPMVRCYLHSFSMWKAMRHLGAGSLWFDLIPDTLTAGRVLVLESSSAWHEQDVWSQAGVLTISCGQGRAGLDALAGRIVSFFAAVSTLVGS